MSLVSKSITCRVTSLLTALARFLAEFHQLQFEHGSNIASTNCRGLCCHIIVSLPSYLGKRPTTPCFTSSECFHHTKKKTLHCLYMCRNQLGNDRRWPCPVPYVIESGYLNPALITASLAEVRCNVDTRDRRFLCCGSSRLPENETTKCVHARRFGLGTLKSLHTLKLLSRPPI